MKKVVSKKNTNEIDISELTPDMIIVYKSHSGGLYKLWKPPGNKYYYTSLEVVASFYGRHDSFDSAIKSKIANGTGNLYVLDDIREISEIPRD